MSALENALVVLFDGKRAYWVYTDSNGQASFTNVVAGTYQYVVIKDGYIHEHGTLTVNTDKTVNVTLTEAVEPTQALITKHETNIGDGKDLEASITTEYETEVA